LPHVRNYGEENSLQQRGINFLNHFYRYFIIMKVQSYGERSAARELCIVSHLTALAAGASLSYKRA